MTESYTYLKYLAISTGTISTDSINKLSRLCERTFDIKIIKKEDVHIRMHKTDHTETELKCK